MKKSLTIFLLSITFISACSSEKQEVKIEKVVHDKAYYLENETERLLTLKRCKSNPVKKRSDADCINAESAKYQIMTNKLLGK